MAVPWPISWLFGGKEEKSKQVEEPSDTASHVHNPTLKFFQERQKASPSVFFPERHQQQQYGSRMYARQLALHAEEFKSVTAPRVYQVPSSWLSREPLEPPREQTLDEYRRLVFGREPSTSTPPPKVTLPLKRRASRVLLDQNIEPPKLSHYLEAVARREAVDKELEKIQGLTVSGGKRARRRLKELPSADEASEAAAIMSDDGFVASLPGAEVSHRSLKRLKPGTWLNDEIITYYGVLINRRSAERAEAEPGKYRKVHCFNNYFFDTLRQKKYAGVRRWTRKIDLFSKDMVIVPINLNQSHWTCAGINIAERQIEYYDSMGSRGEAHIPVLLQYIQDEHADKKKAPLDVSQWSVYDPGKVPGQSNGSDCGVFACQFMENISRPGEGFDFDHNNMIYLRNLMIREIKHGRFLVEP